VQNGGVHFKITRSEGPPFFVYALSKISELLFMLVCIFIAMIAYYSVENLRWFAI